MNITKIQVKAKMVMFWMRANTKKWLYSFLFPSKNISVFVLDLWFTFFTSQICSKSYYQSQSRFRKPCILRWKILKGIASRFAAFLRRHVSNSHTLRSTGNGRWFQKRFWWRHYSRFRHEPRCYMESKHTTVCFKTEYYIKMRG